MAKGQVGRGLQIPTPGPGGPGGPGSPMLPWGPGKPCNGNSHIRERMAHRPGTARTSAAPEARCMAAGLASFGGAKWVMLGRARMLTRIPEPGSPGSPCEESVCISPTAPTDWHCCHGHVPMPATGLFPRAVWIWEGGQP